MKKPFHERLIELLKTDSRFLDEDGELIKAAVIDRAWKIDRELVKLLLSKPQVKDKFFDEIEGHWIFNINTFVDYIADKNFLSNSYTRFRNRIGLNIDGKFLKQRGEVSLVWPYKDCVLEGGQTKEEEKRKEIFFNEILAQDEIDRFYDPKVLTAWKRYTPEGEKKVTEIKRDKNGVIKENLIIKGNNLASLHILRKQFIGKVKLIYIDPPYNREEDGSYNDNFKHSSWLTFMKNRLEVACSLLRPDGCVFISIDDTEQAYLKVLCDEIFDRNNFLANIAYERSGVSGLGQGGDFLVNTHESILCYAKSRPHLKVINLSGESDFGREEMKRYNKVLLKVGKGHEHVRFKAPSTKQDVIIFKHDNYDIRTISLKGYNKRANQIYQEYLGNFKNIFRTTSIQEENKFQNKILSYCTDGLYSARYLVSRGKNKGEYVTVYYLNGQIFVWLKDSAKILDGKIVKTNKLSDFWDHASIPKADLANEGGVKLRRGKKPENLLRRLLEMMSEPDDIIMDYFIGSGTTCAVAHKMGRQWIGIEQLEYGDNDSVVRLKKVVGKRENNSLVEEYKDFDQSGISKSVNWQGGGNFVYFELMKYNQVFMGKIESSNKSADLVKIWKDISDNSFLNWYVNPEIPEDALDDFKEIGKSEGGLEKQKRLLAGLLNKNQLYVNLSEIDDTQFKVSDYDKELNRQFYGETYVR